MSAFTEKLSAAAKGKACALCVGLDPVLERFPSHLRERGVKGIAEFNRAIIDATSDLAAAYKPNLGFYEAYGPDGLQVLEETVSSVPTELVTIGDAKRGDIGHTARQYARALFDRLRFDAVTVSPYMGSDCVLPFLEYEEKGVFVLALTSNPGSADFQRHHDLYLRVVEKVVEWNQAGNVGLVVGAQHPDELAAIRKLVGDMPILVPGVGAQGGDLPSAVAAGKGSMPGCLLVNVSRGVIYASDDADFATQARKAAQQLVDEMN